MVGTPYIRSFYNSDEVPESANVEFSWEFIQCKGCKTISFKQYYIDEGDAYFRSDYRLGYQKARSLYEDALEIGGPDPELKKKIDACEEKLR